MKLSIKVLFTAASLALAVCAHAQAPAGAPAGSTVQCKDGTFASPATKKGACRGHQGVQTWFGPAANDAAAAPAAAPAPAPAAPAAPAKAAAAKPAPAPAAAPAPAPAAKPVPAPAAAAAPGGGAGMVWINTQTKVYHCQGDRYYGKTKQGEYMTEAQAQAQGGRAARNKACGT